MAGPLYDFVVYTKKGREEKLHYMHQNPVRRGLVLTPEQWPWGSAREYLRDEAGPVLVNEPLRAEMKVRDGLGRIPLPRSLLKPRKSKAHCGSSRKSRLSKSAKTGAASVW